jgi:phenylalanyl-tRNA synthetase beta chain
VNASRRWLEAFLGRALDVRELVDRLAMLGAPVDAVEPLHTGLDDIVIGVVESVRPHPDADRLRLCTVRAGGGEPLSVVCGASNVQAGRRYPFAPVGATLPGGLRIERRKIRGEVSEGMLCSARELGLGQDHEGILELEGDWPPGAPFGPALDLGDHRLVLDVTPNRPDLLGHKGLARDLATAPGGAFRLPALPGEDADLPGLARAPRHARAGEFRVDIEETAVCGRFLGAVVRGVRVGRSPEWLRRRVEAVGVRSINNVVDATNYVLYELNQPMHAYDFATLRGGIILARASREGERLATLDGQERRLDAGLPVIADGEGVVGVAGVMGGLATEVTDRTTELFLECAWFVPGRIRAARRALGMSTEASFRFERGTDRFNAPEALRRCLQVILRTAGGAVDGELADVWPEPGHPPRVFLREARVAQVLGVALPRREIERTLVAVGATVVAKPEDGRLAVEVPGWRPDLQAEIDLVEEVARIHGYDAIPVELRPFRPGLQEDAPEIGVMARLREALVGQGLYEAITLPLGPATAEGGVRLANPLSADHVELRQRLLPALIREAERNWSLRTRDVRLFEAGTVFQPGGAGGRPVERQHVGVVVTGAREPGHWTGSGRAPDLDRWDLKGLFEVVLALANPGASVQVEGDAWVAVGDGRQVGWAGPLAADAPPWAAPLYGLEVELTPVPGPLPAFRPLPVTPAVERDLALLVGPGVPVARVLAVMGEAAGELLERTAVLDEYRGGGVPAGARSIAVRLTFRAPDRTLRDREVDEHVRRILSALERSLGVLLRTA